MPLPPDGWREAPAFWLRGIVSEKQIQCQAPNENRLVLAFGAFDRGATEEHTVEAGQKGSRDAIERIESSEMVWYLNESGGKYAECHAQRRCGWGVAALPAPRNDKEADCSMVGGFAAHPPLARSTTALNRK